MESNDIVSPVLLFVDTTGTPGMLTIFPSVVAMHKLFWPSSTSVLIWQTIKFRSSLFRSYMKEFASNWWIRTRFLAPVSLSVRMTIWYPNGVWCVLTIVCPINTFPCSLISYSEKSFPLYDPRETRWLLSNKKRLCLLHQIWRSLHLIKPNYSVKASYFFVDCDSPSCAVLMNKQNKNMLFSRWGTSFLIKQDRPIKVWLTSWKRRQVSELLDIMDPIIRVLCKLDYDKCDS